jgi:predicted LPLAT superfamily acyltransferase
VIDLADPNALLKLSEFIQNGDIAGILGDRVSEGDRTVTCDLLGEPAAFNTGPMRLAAVLEVPVIFFVGLYMGGNKYEIYFEELASYRGLQREERDVQVRQDIEKYAELLEKFIRYQPYNWFNFYDFWNDERK